MELAERLINGYALINHSAFVVNFINVACVMCFIVHAMIIISSHAQL